MKKKLFIPTFNKPSVSLLIIALVVGGISAQAAGVINSPSGGYLVCVNSKTKVITHPGTSSCPKGSKTLVLGAQGIAGADGKTLWNGVKDPESTLGAPGDMFINTTTKTLFGPKDLTTSWPLGVSMVGAAGAQGLGGATGATGAAGSNATLTCAQGGTCVVGNTGPGGGIVFYVQTATAAAPWRYLEAAPNTWSGGNADPAIAWCSVTNNEVPNLLTGTTEEVTTATAIGAGFNNTRKMLLGCTFGAANAAASYNGGGKSDWHLPSKDELNQLCKWARGQAWTSNNTLCDSTGVINTGSAAGFVEGNYWSSSEGNAFSAWFQRFDDGYRSNGTKDFTLGVRPVRAF